MDRDESMLNIHAVIAESRSNGPGRRIAIWFQGCSIRCRGCFNPETHDPPKGSHVTIENLLSRICELAPRHEGVSISGGEPLDQAQGLHNLLVGIRARTNLTILVFSGYEREEIMSLPFGPAILSTIDVLVAGRYVERRRHTTGLRGSANQTIHLLSNRYAPSDFEPVPQAEVWITSTGVVMASGIQPMDISSISRCMEGDAAVMTMRVRP